MKIDLLKSELLAISDESLVVSFEHALWRSYDKPDSVNTELSNLRDELLQRLEAFRLLQGIDKKRNRNANGSAKPKSRRT